MRAGVRVRWDVSRLRRGFCLGSTSRVASLLGASRTAPSGGVFGVLFPRVMRVSGPSHFHVPSALRCCFDSNGEGRNGRVVRVWIFPPFRQRITTSQHRHVTLPFGPTCRVACVRPLRSPDLRMAQLKTTAQVVPLQTQGGEWNCALIGGSESVLSWRGMEGRGEGSVQYDVMLGR